MSRQWFKKLGYKIIIDSRRGLLWIDPVVYNNGEMIGVRKMMDKIWSNPWMGERLRGRDFRVTVFDIPPWIYKKSEKIPGSSEWMAGTHLNVMREISQFYNFTFDITHYVGAGTMLENGTWVGFMASMAYPEYGFDFSFVQGLVSHVHGLWERASYGCIYGTVRLGFVTKHGVNFIPWYAFTAPLQGEVWLVILIIMIFICTVQFTTMYLLNQRKVQNVVVDSGTIIPYAMIMEQGLQEIPKGIRYYSFILLLGGIILSTAYKSTLRVNLVFPLKENIPKTFFELTQRVPEYEVSLWILGLERWLILGNKAIESFGSKLQFIENPKQVELLVKLFQEKDRKSAIISWKTFLGLNIAKYLSLNEKSLGLAFSKDDIYTIYLTPVFVHQSIYTDSFFGIYNGILEAGIYEKNTEWAIQEFVQDGRPLKKKQDVNSQIYKDLVELQNSEVLQTKPMTLWNLRVVFALIPLGGILALFAFLCELEFFSKPVQWIKYYYHLLFNNSALMSPIVSVSLWNQKRKQARHENKNLEIWNIENIHKKSECLHIIK